MRVAMQYIPSLMGEFFRATVSELIAFSRGLARAITLRVLFTVGALLTGTHNAVDCLNGCVLPEIRDACCRAIENDQLGFLHVTPITDAWRTVDPLTF